VVFGAAPVIAGFPGVALHSSKQIAGFLSVAGEDPASFLPHFKVTQIIYLYV
jgi:hypothetical protein